MIPPVRQETDQCSNPLHLPRAGIPGTHTIILKEQPEIEYMSFNFLHNLKRGQEKT